MPRDTSLQPDFAARLSFWLLVILLGILWIAGGASRADVLGQAVVRSSAWAFLIIFVLFSPKCEWRSIWPVALLVAMSIIITAAHLLPLPPAIWTALPGRELLTGAAQVIDQPQPWRPLSISPAATVNALGALVVPAVVLIFCANLTHDQHWRILSILLFLIFLGCVVAILQFSGAALKNPLINYIDGMVSGNFANRNHFSLFVALGCLLSLVWGFQKRNHRWKSFAALGLVIFFLLVNLATGSRSGLLLGGVAIIAGALIVRAEVRKQLRTMPRWMAVALISVLIIAFVSAVATSLLLGRAVSIDRTVDRAVSEDLRVLALPYVIQMLKNYFPLGAGAGTFDPAYRILEPDQLLTTQYFNHAHNDWLEVVIDTGAVGLILMLAAMCWWAIRSWRSYRDRSNGVARLGRTASMGLLLVMLASLTDYPVRTPMMMAVVVILAIWITLGGPDGRRSSVGDASDANFT